PTPKSYSPGYQKNEDDLDVEEEDEAQFSGLPSSLTSQAISNFKLNYKSEKNSFNGENEKIFNYKNMSNNNSEAIENLPPIENYQKKERSRWRYHTTSKLTNKDEGEVQIYTIWSRPTMVKPISRAAGGVWFTFRSNEPRNNILPNLPAIENREENSFRPLTAPTIQYRFEHSHLTHNLRLDLPEVQTKPKTAPIGTSRRQLHSAKFTPSKISDLETSCRQQNISIGSDFSDSTLTESEEFNYRYWFAPPSSMGHPVKYIPEIIVSKIQQSDESEFSSESLFSRTKDFVAENYTSKKNFFERFGSFNNSETKGISAEIQQFQKEHETQQLSNESLNKSISSNIFSDANVHRPSLFTRRASIYSDSDPKISHISEQIPTQATLNRNGSSPHNHHYSINNSSYRPKSGTSNNFHGFKGPRFESAGHTHKYANLPRFLFRRNTYPSIWDDEGPARWDENGVEKELECRLTGATVTAITDVTLVMSRRHLAEKDIVSVDVVSELTKMGILRENDNEKKSSVKKIIDVEIPIDNMHCETKHEPVMSENGIQILEPEASKSNNDVENDASIDSEPVFNLQPKYDMGPEPKLILETEINFK
ncbi:hypothetical protein HK096_008027, partial [Nowakowskiella sp. JEL0078]